MTTAAAASVPAAKAAPRATGQSQGSGCQQTHLHHLQGTRIRITR
ncbi:hypothetical protein E2C01_029028 [Portunus trituberculatus]|uniref:Uncharacterized protein n=1 Tax=Portunus trituberculatus TaxID=210409 RepID=A0A5B7EN35_PORTR|nr:hypothetical protein [Portunus trituberculatus]